MKKKKTEKATEVVHQLWAKAQENNISIKLSHASLNSGVYQSIPDGTKKRFIPQAIIVCAKNLFSMLEVAEFKLIQKISLELYSNNALWFFDPKSIGGRSEKTIRALRSKKILIPTSNSTYHIVNPFAIRNGGLPKVIAGTLYLLDREEDFNDGMLKDVRLPATYMANIYTLDKSENEGDIYALPFL